MRFFRLAHRLAAYQTVIRSHIEAEQNATQPNARVTYEDADTEIESTHEVLATNSAFAPFVVAAT